MRVERKVSRSCLGQKAGKVLYEEGHQGNPAAVSAGDTITVVHDGKGEKISFYDVDAPEGGQELVGRAKRFTSDFAFGEIADVEPVDTDRYGRTVGIVSIDCKVLDRTSVVAGMAWVYEKYCTRDECMEWRRLQKKAQTSKVGLWAMPNPVPPWEYRKARQ